jgi:D-psicose/D-tagatose/L-ribulose 3-epimerase
VSWRLGLVDSAWFGSPWEGRTGLEQTKEIGFEAVDLFVGYDPAERSAAQREAQRRELDEIGLPVWALLCTPLGLADFNDGVRRYHIERSTRVVDLASDLGAESFMLCPGEYVFQQELLPPEWEWGRLVEAVREIGEHAGERGLTVAVELLPFKYAFINSVEAMVRLLDEVGLECVTAAIDISHFWLQRIDPSELSRLDGRIGQVHIADCDGVHHGDLPAGSGTTPFADYLAAIRDAGFEGTASVELEFPPDPSRMLEWVSEAYRGSLEVLEQAGMRGSDR